MIFEIDKRDLAKLSDVQLRELVARLCMAERESVGGHRNEVRWGGEQTANDGGIDVRVDCFADFAPTPVLPRRSTGIQVKKSDYPKGKVLEEMRPNGVLRDAILKLALEGGAYLIVSGADCTPSKIENRKSAMRAALGSECNDLDIHIDFLGRQEVADWVSKHRSVALWLRKRLNLPSLRGWQGYGCWSGVPAGQSDALIEGQGLKMTGPDGRVYSGVVDVIQCLRVAIRNAEKSIRVVGLSGIGKTRLVQEIFASGGVDAIPESWAIYTDEGHDPDPQPLAMLQWLIGLQPAVLVVDNCGRELHNKLSQLWIQKKPAVRLVTIEYDVKLDEPAETDVYQLEVVDTDIAEVLIRRRFPRFSEFDARKLAVLSEGNTRLALALAGAAPRHQSLSCFSEVELFNRLFWQRNQPDAELERCARVLALVYSFDMDLDDTELHFLAGIVRVDSDSLRAGAGLLYKRQLAQTRGRWCAVLPHALANRLAGEHLDDSNAHRLASAFAGASERLRKSFARRLSFLHGNQNARRIVDYWMIPGGPLDPDRKTRIAECLELLQLICHLSPAAALDKLKWVVDKIGAEADVDFESRYYFHAQFISDALVRLAYADEEFGQACDLLLKFVLVGSKPHIDNARHSLVSLFLPQLSGSIAKTATRVAWVRKALDSSDDREVDIGVDCVRAALIGRAWAAVSVSVVDTRPSPYGRRLSRSEALDWVQDWSRLSVDVAIKATKLSWRLRHLLAEFAEQAAKHFPAALDYLLQAIIPLNQQELWVEGWNALQSAVRSGKVADCERIYAIMTGLEPVELVDRIRAVLRSKGYQGQADNGTCVDGETADRRHDACLAELGESLARCPELLEVLAEDILNPCHDNPVIFGKAIAQADVDQIQIWNILRPIYAAGIADDSNLAILGGYLAGLDESHPSLAATVRDECLNHPALGRRYASLASWPCRTPEEFERLFIAVQNSDNPRIIEHRLRSMNSGLNLDQRLRLMRVLLSNPVGARTVLSALADMVRRGRTVNVVMDRELVMSAIEAVLKHVAEDVFCKDQHLDHELSELIQCGLFDGDIDAECVTRLLTLIKQTALRKWGFFKYMNETTKSLVNLSATDFLDVLLECDRTQFGIISWEPEYCPLAGVEVPILLDWCGTDPERSALVARSIEVFSARQVAMDGRVQAAGWELSPVARALLERAPTRGEVLEAFLSRVASFGFGVSHDLVVAQIDALNVLTQHPDPGIRVRAGEFISTTRQRIETDRRKELERERERALRFE